MQSTALSDLLDKSDEWPQVQYARVAELRVGANRSAFDEWLDTAPVRTERSGERQQDFYVREGYWVHAYSTDGVVTQWTLTSCDREFQPRFAQPINDMRAEYVRPGPLMESSAARIGVGAVGGELNVPMSNSPTYMEKYGGSSEAMDHIMTGWGRDTSCWLGDLPDNPSTGEPRDSWSCDVLNSTSCEVFSISQGATIPQDELGPIPRRPRGERVGSSIDDCTPFLGS